MSPETQGAKRSTEPVDLQALIETIPALVVCTLGDGSAEFANRAWQEYTGHPLEELAGSGWRTTIHPDDLGKFLNELPVRLPSGETEARIRAANGQYRWFSVRKTVAVWRTPTSPTSLHTLIACEDINERRQHEAALRDIGQRYRIMVEAASDAVVCIDESGAILVANPATIRVFGYEPAELIGKPLTVLMPEFLRKVHEDGFRRYLATGQRHINWHGTELTGLRKNGEGFPVEVSFGEVAADGHRIFTGFVRDISERKQAEELRASLHTAQVELARISRVTTMGELTASLAHEINQPIGAAVTNAQACLRFLNPDQPDVPEAREAALEMVRDATRAADIIDRVRSLCRKGSSKLEMVDVNEVIREMVVMLRNEANRYSVTVRTELDETVRQLMADRVQLQQVLMNIMLNGIEAMRDAGGELRIKSELAEDGQLMISVSDMGVGLPTGKADEIFNAFFTTKPQGTGLGLAITRSIVESHGGRIWAAANPGRGATFHFTLPQQRAAHA